MRDARVTVRVASQRLTAIGRLDSIGRHLEEVTNRKVLQAEGLEGVVHLGVELLVQPPFAEWPVTCLVGAESRPVRGPRRRRPRGGAGGAYSSFQTRSAHSLQDRGCVGMASMRRSTSSASLPVSGPLERGARTGRSRVGSSLVLSRVGTKRYPG